MTHSKTPLKKYIVLGSNGWIPGSSDTLEDAKLMAREIVGNQSAYTTGELSSSFDVVQVLVRYRAQATIIEETPE
jgi:hypothetical protein